MSYFLVPVFDHQFGLWLNCSVICQAVLRNNLYLTALNSSVLGMAAPKPFSRLISHVILDLDGTLLNTGD